MKVTPKVRGFICTTAHPTGCGANVARQAEYVRGKGELQGPKRVLVIGASTGYGLACRIVAAVGCGADTVGVAFERPAAKGRTATAGWYNTAAFDALAAAQGRKAVSINGDAFSEEIKAQTIEAVRQLPGGQVDMVIYSLAAPRRQNPRTGVTHNSVIKPVGEPFASKTVDVNTAQVTEVRVDPATEEEVRDTVAVMGGEDWLWWMQVMQQAGVLAPGVCTLAFSYIGPEQTHAIYKNGSIGRAKQDLEDKAAEIDALLAPVKGKAFVSVNKALVTQASSAIPVVPLYIALLYKIMKEQGSHEGCIEQMYRMFRRIYADGAQPGWAKIPIDEGGRIRMDDWEMASGVQARVNELWQTVNSENIASIADLNGYQQDFYQLFGFQVPGVDYEAEVEI